MPLHGLKIMVAFNTGFGLFLIYSEASILLRLDYFVGESGLILFLNVKIVLGCAFKYFYS